jgi:hypothetical protein
VSQPPAMRMFDDVPLIGDLPQDQVAEKLRELGDAQAANELDSPVIRRRGVRQILPWGQPKPWQHTGMQIGYLPPRSVGNVQPLPIQHGSLIDAEPALKDGRISIHLDHLRVFDYPGGGMHRVLLTFKGLNQLATDQEVVSFNHTYRVQGGQPAGVSGYPVFGGLQAGSNGVAFQGHIVNVKNDRDAAFLELLESPAFQQGLNLLTTVQPVMKPFTDLTLGIAKQFASRTNNVAVYDFYLGLDFSSSAFGARLAEGNFIVVQAPSPEHVDWADWTFVPTSGAIMHRDGSKSLPYNYLVFRVSRHHD